MIIIAQHWNLNEYAITPGDATPVAPLVKVHGVATDATHDKILLTDVYLTRVTVWQWFRFQFEHHVEFVTPNQLLEPGVPSDELNAQGYLEMSDSKQAAEVAAFRALGWKVPSRPTGAVINAVFSPSPARRGHLHVGDKVVGVNGVKVDSACALIRALHHVAPSATVHFDVRPVAISNTGVLSWGAPVVRTLVTGPPERGLVSSGCSGVNGPSSSSIGVSLEDGRSYHLPATVSIDTANIGGPSAGLAMTLALIDRLSKGSLTGGHVVAATGTMSANGTVGDVGGVAEKTVAVQRAGATYFIVPQVEVATARANAAPGLTVLGVTSLAQALKDLRALGGATPTALTRPS